MPVVSIPAIVIWVFFWLNARSRCVLGLILFLRWLLAGKVKVFVKEALLIERTFFFGDRSDTGYRARDGTTIPVKRKVALTTILTNSGSE